MMIDGREEGWDYLEDYDDLPAGQHDTIVNNASRINEQNGVQAEDDDMDELEGVGHTKLRNKIMGQIMDAMLEHLEN